MNTILTAKDIRDFLSRANDEATVVFIDQYGTSHLIIEAQLRVDSTSQYVALIESKY